MEKWMEEWEKRMPKHATRMHRLFAYIRLLEAKLDEKGLGRIKGGEIDDIL